MIDELPITNNENRVCLNGAKNRFTDDSDKETAAMPESIHPQSQ